jgi:hypothetical protein
MPFLRFSAVEIQQPHTINNSAEYSLFSCILELHVLLKLCSPPASGTFPPHIRLLENAEPVTLSWRVDRWPSELPIWTIKIPLFQTHLARLPQTCLVSHFQGISSPPRVPCLLAS